MFFFTKRLRQKLHIAPPPPPPPFEYAPDVYGITFGGLLQLMNNFYVFSRFHNSRSMTKKLCGLRAHW